jgi:serine/threonine protein kinase/Flp pilus assembly protein TadD
MNPERWQQVKRVLDNVMERTQPDRAAFLDQACEGDQAMRQEVESLLAAGDEGRSDFLQSPPTTHLVKGTRVGDYEIQSLLGAGGMGEVYRARDLRLRRDVAVKVLPAVVSSDPERLRRFEQEARAAAALNHPNVLAVHQLGRYAGTMYLVSELLEGETLREQIKRARVELHRVIDYAVQIAHGLAAAHEKGIVHRDLKPENLFVTKDGRIKILDFGLAKLTQAQLGSEHSAPTIGSETEPGIVMGTVGYMSPEQVRGQNTDYRADIFAFGAILYEMLTGKRAFQKPTSPETMSAILNEDPPGISQIAPGLPAALQQIVHRCLEKNPEQRFQSASDLAFALTALTDAQEALPAQRKNIWKTVAPLAVLSLAGLIAGAFYYRSHPSRRLTDKDTLVLADFANSTGDPVFDDTLKTALNVSLRQSPFLNVLSDSEVVKTLQQMTRPADAELTAAVAREVCQRTGSRAYLVGSVGSLGSEYVLGLKAVNCQTGATLAQEQLTAASKNNVLNELGRMAARFRAELGESLMTLPQYDVPLADATTSSLEALKAYSLGEKAFREKGVDALPHYQRAIALDPNFAMAYTAVGLLYASLGEPERASEYYTKAFHLREHASEREKLSIEAAYYVRVTGELDKAAAVYQEEISNYPREALAYRDLAGVYSADGLWARAAEIGNEAVRLAPDWVAGYEALANYAIDLQRFDETRLIIERAHARKLDDPGLHIDLYALAFLASDAMSMDEQVQWFASNPAYENTGLGLASDTEAYAGHLGKARELTERAIDSAIRADNKEGAGVWKEIAAQREAVFGNTIKAKLAAEQGLKLHSKSLGIELEAALAFAMMGDAARAEELARDLNKRYPQDTQIQSIWLPAVRAQVAINHGDPALAFDALHAPSPIELGNIRFVNNGSCLYSSYVRGEAYLAAGQGSVAAAEFQKILDHSGIVWNCWTGALAHLGVARANALQSTNAHGADADAARVRALSAYKDFLTLWKDADADIPILKKAKAEYAKLQ